MGRKILLLAAALVAIALLVFRPVCRPLAPDELKAFNVPIEQRIDRQLYFRVFQRRGNQWYQCKTWLSRQFFF